MFIRAGRVEASLNHLTPMEINSIRPVFPDTLDALLTLHDVRCCYGFVLFFNYSFRNTINYKSIMVVILFKNNIKIIPLFHWCVYDTPLHSILKHLQIKETHDIFLAFE